MRTRYLYALIIVLFSIQSFKSDDGIFEKKYAIFGRGVIGARYSEDMPEIEGKNLNEIYRYYRQRGLNVNPPKRAGIEVFINGENIVHDTVCFDENVIKKIKQDNVIIYQCYWEAYPSDADREKFIRCTFVRPYRLPETTKGLEIIPIDAIRWNLL